MQRDQIFQVIGLRVSGDRVVITKDTDRKTAEQIVSVMTKVSTFADLFIEPDGDGETPSGDCGFSACDHPAPAGFTHTK